MPQVGWSGLTFEWRRHPELASFPQSYFPVLCALRALQTSCLKQDHDFSLYKFGLCSLSGFRRGLSIFVKSALKHESDWINFLEVQVLLNVKKMLEWAGRAETGVGAVLAGELGSSATRRWPVAMAAAGPCGGRFAFSLAHFVKRHSADGINSC